MNKTSIHNEYNTNPNNKMMIRIPYKVSSMNNNRVNLNTIQPSKMNVVLQFPETSEASDYVIDEVRLILLDIFQKNMKEQLPPSTAPHSNAKELTHESN